MNQVLSRIWLWLWYLLPANPILVRVVYTASRRIRHLWLRMGYLTALLVVVVFSMFVSISGGTSASLADLAKGASRTFQWASFTQLALMCFLAPVFTAGAITQERDSQTLNILLSTPLTNAQIVFGSLMSRLYFVLLLLLGGLPIFLVTMIYGGVTRSQVFESFALAGATAILTGALAIFIAMLGVGTRRTIFSFYLLIFLYLVVFYQFGRWQNTWIAESPPNIIDRKMSFLAPFHPFLALEVSLRGVNAPPYTHLAGRTGLVRFALAYPSMMYVIWTTLLAFLMTISSLAFVRRGSKVGETTVWSRLRDRLPIRTGTQRRSVRHVWHNPVAWREAKTRAAGGRFTRWMVIGAGIVISAVLFFRTLSGTLPPDKARDWLAGLVAVQFGVALLIATNTAATSLTKEKEAKSLDLLLTTPLTSRYILWGKLRGLVSFALPLLAVPVVAMVVFCLPGLFGSTATAGLWIESALELAALMIIFAACACVIGLKVSMITRKNVTAVMYSIGILILLCAVSWGLGMAIVTTTRGEFAAFFAPFTPFTAVLYLVDPVDLYDSPREFAEHAAAARTAALVGSVIATAVYAFIVWSAYAGLVRSFDMTMRKQTGT